MLPMIVVQN